MNDQHEQAKAFARKMAALQIRNGFEPTHLHTYTDATGQPLYWKTRAKHPTTGEKWIRSFHHDGASFVAREPAFTGGKPLYRLHELLNADAGQAVYICEGEQKADYLHSLGLIATTSGGKSSANATDWQPLAGRRVIVWPDFDDAGQLYQADVTSILSGLGCELWAVDVAQLDLPAKGDVIDWQQQRTASGMTTTAADVMDLPVVKIEPAAQPQIEDAQPATDAGDGIPDGHLCEPMQYGGGRFEVLPNGLYFVDKDKAHRVGSRFALIAAGGEIATDAGITGWSKGEATQAAAICFNAWLESFGMIGNHEERAILAHVKAFFEAHGSSRFEAFYQPDPDKHERINNRAGYWKADNDSRRYLVFPEQFKTEICKGYDHRQVSKVLVTSGILVTAGDSRPDKLCRIPERDKATRMYEINSNMLFSDGYTGYNGYNGYNPDSIDKNIVTNPKTDLVTMVTSVVTDTASAHSGDPLASVTSAVTSRNQPCNQAKTDSKTSNNNAVTNVTAVTTQKQPNPPVTAVTTPPQQWSIEL